MNVKNKNLRKMLPLVIISLLLGSMLTAFAVPLVPMTVFGHVFVDAAPAGAGLNVYAKHDTTIVTSTTTDSTGYYLLSIAQDSGLENGASIDLYVGTTYADTVTLEYQGEPLELDLHVAGAPPEPDTGTLSIDTSPVKGAVSVNGVSWGTAPQSQVVAVGSYTVSFGAVAGYITPAAQSAVVTKDAVKTVMGTYVVIPAGDTGTLSIDTSPVKGAVSVNGVSWGTAPQSQVVAVGSYTVSFGAVAGYITPSPVSATVTKDTVTPITGTYVVVVIPTGDLITKIQYFDDPDWIDWAAPVLKGDEIRVVGKGVTAGATVNVYWDNAMKETFTAGSGKVASGTAKSAGTFSIKFVVPEGLVGTHYIWVKDVATGKTDSIAVNVAPKMTVSPSSGLKGDKVTITGYGYGYDDDNDKGLEVTIDFSDFGVAVTPSPTEPKTNSLGTWTATFTVPSIDYDPYYIYAVDADLNADTDGVKFTVGASITLSISTGPVGSVVTITGRGFDKEETLTVDIAGASCYIVSGKAVRSDGRISAKVVIPDKDLVDDEPTKYTVTVQDESGNAPTASFTVDGVAEIKATPSYGVQGSQITLEGWNFTKISGTEVTVVIGSSSKTLKTDSKGYFKGTIQIPATGSGDQILSAAISDHHISADATIRVGLMMVILTPNSGPSGTRMSITGVGFETSAALTVKLGDDEWFTTDAVDGLLSEFRNVPSLAPGAYTVTVIEDETEIEVTATLTVTEKTNVALSPVMAPNEYEVTVEGWYFAESPEDASLEFVLYNATSEWILSVTYSNADAIPAIPVSTVELGLDEDWDDGYFKGKFLVPEDDSISIGSYTMNVTDGMGMFAQIAFQVVPKTTTITARKATFRIGETVAFNVESSFKQEDAYIKIYDPSGNQYWRTDAFATGKWTKIGNVQIYPFYQQTAGGNAMILMEDAPLGTYTWKWYDADAELLDSGSFTVAAATESLLGQQITDLNEAVTGLTDDITTVSTEVAAVRTQITNAINAANAAVTAANAATQAVNAVAQTASAASTAATNAAAAATEAKNAANGLTTLVYGAIGASLVAALAAIVSLMQISRRIAG